MSYKCAKSTGDCDTFPLRQEPVTFSWQFYSVFAQVYHMYFISLGESPAPNVC